LFIWAWNPVALREVHRLRVSANRVLRISGHVKEESKETGGNYITRTFKNCALHQMLLE
jgi:hypothetical protein